MVSIFDQSSLGVALFSKRKNKSETKHMKRRCSPQIWHSSVHSSLRKFPYESIPENEQGEIGGTENAGVENLGSDRSDRKWKKKPLDPQTVRVMTERVCVSY